MKISEVEPIIRAEWLLGRTPSGRSVTLKGIETAKATLADEKNMDAEATKCLNCEFIASSLLFEAGCKNCGSKDLTDDAIVDAYRITKEDT